MSDSSAILSQLLHETYIQTHSGLPKCTRHFGGTCLLHKDKGIAKRLHDLPFSSRSLATIRRISGEVTTERLEEDAKSMLDMCNITDEAHRSSLMQQVFKDKTTTDWPLIIQSQEQGPSQEQGREWLSSFFTRIQRFAARDMEPDFCVEVSLIPSWTAISCPEESLFYPFAHVVVSKENKLDLTADPRLGSTSDLSFEDFLAARRRCSDTRRQLFSPHVDRDEFREWQRLKGIKP